VRGLDRHYDLDLAHSDLGIHVVGVTLVDAAH
jgi:hypothetical protein